MAIDGGLYANFVPAVARNRKERRRPPCTSRGMHTWVNIMAAHGRHIDEERAEGKE
jgi:hypothetical protein